MLHHLVLRGMPNLKYQQELLSTKWGKLTVLTFAGYTEKHRRTLWNCRCDCGAELVVRSDCLRAKPLATGSVKSCGCARVNLPASASPQWRGHGQLSMSKWTCIGHDARKRGLSVTVTIQDVWDIYVGQGGKCAITGRPIEFSLRSKGASTASLDRIDSTKGYEIGNLWWVHKRINIMKSDMTMEEFTSLCRDVANFSTQ